MFLEGYEHRTYWLKNSQPPTLWKNTPFKMPKTCFLHFVEKMFQ